MSRGKESRPKFATWLPQSTSSLLPVSVAAMWPSSRLGSLQPGPLKLRVLLPRPQQLAAHVLHLGTSSHVSRDKEKEIWLKILTKKNPQQQQHRRFLGKFLCSVLFCLTRHYICIHKQAQQPRTNLLNK